MKKKKEDKEQKKMLTVNEVAAILQIHTRTIYKWILESKIPHTRIAGAIRFDEDTFMKWKEENTIYPERSKKNV